jgi:hypothetical protein
VRRARSWLARRRRARRDELRLPHGRARLGVGRQAWKSTSIEAGPVNRSEQVGTGLRVVGRAGVWRAGERLRGDLQDPLQVILFLAGGPSGPRGVLA